MPRLRTGDPFGDFIRSRRVGAGLFKQSDLGDVLDAAFPENGWTVGKISRIEIGQYRPNVEELAHLQSVLGLDLTLLGSLFLGAV